MNSDQPSSPNRRRRPDGSLEHLLAEFPVNLEPKAKATLLWRPSGVVRGFLVQVPQRPDSEPEHFRVLSLKQAPDKSLFHASGPIPAFVFVGEDMPPVAVDLNPSTEIQLVVRNVSDRLASLVVQIWGRYEQDQQDKRGEAAN